MFTLQAPFLILDLCKIARSQGKSGRVKTVLSEGEVSVDTSIEEKQFVAIRQAHGITGHIWSGDEGALRKSSKIKIGSYF